MSAKNPYTVLGVSKDADEKAIKSAFRKLAKKYHPDQNQNNPRAKERFAEVSQAHEILGDKDKRQQFDRGEIDEEGKQKFSGFSGGGSPFGGRSGGGADPFGSGSASGGGFGGAEDILSEMFGAAFSGGSRSGRTHGFSNQGFSGFGGQPGAGASGAGASGAGARARGGSQSANDLDIKLSARVSVEDLARGKATVTMPDGKSIAMSIPAGAKDGQTIRLKGKGKSIPGHGSGDALVTIRFQAHPDFAIEGANLRTHVKVPLKTAVTGGKVPVTTLDGRINLTIPEWTTSGKVMRLKGRGLPTKDNSHGDLLVVTLVDLPDTPDPELKNLFK